MQVLLRTWATYPKSIVVFIFIVILSFCLFVSCCLSFHESIKAEQGIESAMGPHHLFYFSIIRWASMAMMADISHKDNW